MPRILSGGIWNTVAAAPFYALFDDGSIYKVTSLAASGGAATLLTGWQSAAGSDYAESIHAGGGGELSLVVDVGGSSPNAEEFKSSGDGGATWSTSSTSKLGNETRIRPDLAHRLIGWYWLIARYGGTAPNSRTYDVTVFITTDGGATWTPQVLETLSPLNVASTVEWGAAPLSDGTYAYLAFVVVTTNVSPNEDLYIYRVKTDGTWSKFIISAWRPKTYGVPYFMSADPTDTDSLYFVDLTSIYKVSWLAQTYTSVTASVPWNPSTGNADTPTDYLILPTGTQILLGYAGIGAQLVIYRSTDAGVTWTAIDLSAMETDQGNFNGLLAYSSNNVLSFVLGDGGIAFSTDDGATWNKTSILTTSAHYLQDYAAA